MRFFTSKFPILTLTKTEPTELLRLAENIQEEKQENSYLLEQLTKKIRKKIIA